MSIDIRDPEEQHVSGALALLDRAVRDSALAEGVGSHLKHYRRVPSTPFSPEVVDAVERAAARSDAVTSGSARAPATTPSTWPPSARRG